MSDIVMKQLPMLEVLASASPKERRKILVTADFGLVSAIVECIHNVLQGVVDITMKHKRRLASHKNSLRKVMKGGRRWLHKKKAICQKGGSFIPALLAPVLTVLLDRLTTN